MRQSGAKLLQALSLPYLLKQEIRSDDSIGMDIALG